MIVKKIVGVVNDALSNVLKPAVLGVIEWKNEDKILPIGDKFFNVDGLLYSKTNIHRAPTKISKVVTIITTFVCNEYLLKLLWPYISIHTENPKPPIIINIIVVILIIILSTYGVKLLYPPIKSNPALQKAAMEWNIP